MYTFLRSTYVDCNQSEIYNLLAFSHNIFILFLVLFNQFFYLIFAFFN
jgi:hypothetical protein